MPPFPAPLLAWLRSSGGQRVGWLRAYCVVVLCTGIAELMSAHSDLADILMVYLAGVVYVALHEGMRTSVLTVLASVFLFDLIYVPPRWGLNPVHPSHIFTLVVMLVVGLLISHLTARVREETALAERRARRAQALSELAARLAAARTHADIEATVSAATSAALGKACTLDASGTLCLVQDGRPLPPEERELLEGFTRQARLAVERSAFERQSAEALVATESELSGVSHDFRTPLTTIIGAATSLLDQEARLDARMRQTLAGSILEEAHRLHERMSHLLDLTRMQEGAVALRPEWCPADDLVAEALRTLQGRLERHAISLDVPVDAIVWCDPRLVEQALANLVDNAARYTPPGLRISVSVRVESGTWLLAVADDGPGLPAGGEQAVFRRFHRGHAEAAGTGFGLGLALCAAVAKLHGGTIDARNASGATFTMRLPQPARAPMEEA